MPAEGSTLLTGLGREGGISVDTTLNISQQRLYSCAMRQIYWAALNEGWRELLACSTSNQERYGKAGEGPVKVTKTLRDINLMGRRWGKWACIVVKEH